MYETHKGNEYTITTDPRKIDLDAVCSMLKKSYWASNRKRETIESSINNSECFSLYCGDRQIGFARMVTDYSIFAYLCDVYIEEDYRGRGLGKWLIESILSHPAFKNILCIDLSTRDAHELYRKFGFNELPKPENFMIRINSGI